MSLTLSPGFKALLESRIEAARSASDYRSLSLPDKKRYLIESYSGWVGPFRLFWGYFQLLRSCPSFKRMAKTKYFRHSFSRLSILRVDVAQHKARHDQTTPQVWTYGNKYTYRVCGCNTPVPLPKAGRRSSKRK